MENKNTKIHFDNNIFFTFLGLFILGTTLLSFNILKKTDCNAIDLQIITKSKTVLDLIEFRSLGDGQYKWEWDFGDGSDEKYTSNTLHQYKKDSTYIITLKINDNCVLTKEIVIKKKKLIDPAIKKLIPKVRFPSTILQGKEVEFRCTSSFAKKWEWHFGESQKIDATTERVKYKFKTGGIHTISLITNDDDKSVYVKNIYVTPIHKPKKGREEPNGSDNTDEGFGFIPEGPEGPEGPTIPEPTPAVIINFSESDLSTMLNDYSSEKIKYIDVSSNFCNENIKVIGIKNKNTNLKNLLSTIRGKKIKIKNLTLLKGDNGCAKIISINLQVKNGLFWKKY